MIRVFIAKSLFLLKLYSIVAGFNKGFFVCCSSYPSFRTAFLAKRGIKPVIPKSSTRSHQEAILDNYIEAVGKLGESNSHRPHWWMTDIASKNAYCSPLLQPLKELSLCIDAIELIKSTNSVLFIIDPSWPTIKAIKRAAVDKGWSFKILSWPFSRVISVLLGSTNTWIAMLRSAIGTLREIVRTKKSFGCQRHLSNKGQVYLIKSFVYADSFKDNGGYQDPFFGGLADYLMEKMPGNSQVLTIAVGSVLKHHCYQKMKDLKKNLVIPLESMLCSKDVVGEFCYLCWTLITKPFKVKGNIEFLGYNISDLLRELLASGGWYIQFYQYIHLAAAQTLARNYCIMACAMTYEGNPWERAFIKGIKSVDPSTQIIGYQHSVIPQAAANMFLSPGERTAIPLPDIIFTTGTIPARLLLKYGAYQQEQIKVSCALRYNYLDDIQVPVRQISRDSKRIRILVALDGVSEALILAKYAINQARSNEDIEFLMRAHPVLPFEKLCTDDMNPLPANIKISNGSTVMEDLLKTDAVLYWGSSVALEGIRLGKPVIHFNQDDFLSHDPLFDLEDFKWVINSQEDIKEDILRQISNISDDKFEELRNRAQRYVIDYHKPVDEESMALFLLPLNQTKSYLDQFIVDRGTER